MSIPEPSRIKALDVSRLPSYWNEKITLEPDAQYSTRTSKRFSLKPDMGDQRESSTRALPTPPRTPKRVIRQFRISAVLVGALAVVSFVLSLLVLLAGRKSGYFEDVFMIRLNATTVGKDVIRFDSASATTAAAPAATTSSSSNPFDSPLNPFSPSSPLNPSNPKNPLNPILGPIADNITDSLNDGIGDAVNKVVDGLFEASGLKGIYSLHLDHICVRKEGQSGGAAETCRTYAEAQAELLNKTSSIQSFFVIGPTNISVPIIAELSKAGGGLFDTLDALRRAIFAFVIASLVGSGFVFLLTIPSVLFSASRLLIYANIFMAYLSSLFAFLAALVLTVMVVATSTLLGGLGKALNLIIEQGAKMMIFLWVSWILMVVAGAYWGLVWFVEVRRWSFVRRHRAHDEVGNWKGIRGEVWRDLKGSKSQ